jgi:hypothetical protein
LFSAASVWPRLFINAALDGSEGVFAYACMPPCAMPRTNQCDKLHLAYLPVIAGNCLPRDDTLAYGITKFAHLNSTEFKALMLPAFPREACAVWNA